MTKAFKALVWIVILAVVISAAFVLARAVRERKEARAKAAAVEETHGPMRVGVIKAAAGRLTVSVWATGEVRALSAVDVTPKLVGRLERMRLPDGRLIEEGVVVSRGETVAVIEHAQQSAALEAAEAAVSVAAAGLERARVGLADAQRERDRWIELRKQGSGTDQQRDQAVTAYDRAQAELKLAEAQVAQAGAAREQARVAVSEATLHAPLGGLVARKYVDEGAFVGPSTPLFRLVDLSQVEVTCGVADLHLARITADRTQAQVEVDAYPGEQFGGTVSRVRPEIDRVTRTVAVTIRIANADGRLRPGMYARVRLVLAQRDRALLVPDEALVRSETGSSVYVVKDGKAELRPVKLGLKEANQNEVLGGLEAGETVVVRGVQMVQAGGEVEAEEVTLQ